MRKVIEFLIELDNELGLFNLQFDNRQDQYISENLKEKNEYQQKHMRQISSIVGHVNTVVDSSKIFELAFRMDKTLIVHKNLSLLDIKSRKTQA